MPEIDVQQDGRNDFDFLVGSWNVHHRALRERLKGSTEWIEFAGKMVCRKIIGGMGNIDENILERPSGTVEAITLRLFNPASRQWSIYWADSQRGTLDVPMIGGFKDERGEFYSQEVFEGRHILSRFIWSRTDADTCHWEQAFSDDGGKTWETNWFMDFSRSQE